MKLIGHLPAAIIDKLAVLPESGQGYQLVKFTMRDGRTVENVVVLNGTEALGLDDALCSQVADVVLIELTAGLPYLPLLIWGRNS